MPVISCSSFEVLSWPPRIEVLLQVAPAVDVALLQLRQVGCVSRALLGDAGSEHEGHRPLKPVRLQLNVARLLKSGSVRAMWQHAVVKGKAAGNETFRLGVIAAIDQPHELTHDVHVVPGWPEGILGHGPAIREND